MLSWTINQNILSFAYFYYYIFITFSQTTKHNKQTQQKRKTTECGHVGTVNSKKIQQWAHFSSSLLPFNLLLQDKTVSR